jgi:polyhydroxyalkanoate synthesis regulator phasin
MVSLKGEIVQEAKVYVDHVQAESNKNSKLQMQLLQRKMKITLDAIEAAHLDISELENNMDFTN